MRKAEFMSKSIIVAISALEERHRQAIREAADRHGCTVRFFNTDAAALPFLADAEIVFECVAEDAEVKHGVYRLTVEKEDVSGDDHRRLYLSCQEEENPSSEEILPFSEAREYFPVCVCPEYRHENYSSHPDREN